jgi:hypothetical protein
MRPSACDPTDDAPGPTLTRQLPLDLGFASSYAAADYLVSASNADAFAWVERWPDWPGVGLALCGPPGCGKTHLAHVWRERSRATIIDAATLTSVDPSHLLASPPALAIDGLAAGSLDAAAERALLHLYNMTNERRGHLRACRSARALDDRAAGLALAPGALPAVSIAPPDDGLLEVLLPLFADRQSCGSRHGDLHRDARMIVLRRARRLRPMTAAPRHAAAERPQLESGGGVPWAGARSAVNLSAQLRTRPTSRCMKFWPG